MSGGRLVVLDRAGRAGKQFPLGAGLATLGSDPACDICVLQEHVSAHHATVAVHAAQTVVRNVGDGETLVNGVPVSVAALRHGDVLMLGERELRWEYDDPRRGPPHGPAAALGGARRGAARGRRGGTPRAAPARDRAVQLALELRHRASMPARAHRADFLSAHLAAGSAGGKQVAIVQPQRRDTSDQTEPRSGRGSPAGRGAGRAAPTRATLWVEARARSPRRASLPPARPARPAPLRLTVLKRAQSAHGLIKIQAPLEIDHTKQAAIMLMTGHTPKSKLIISPQSRSQNKKSPSYVVKKSSFVRKERRAGRSDIVVTPSRGSSFAPGPSNRRSSKRHSDNKSETVLEVTDSTRNSSIRPSDISKRSRKSSHKSSHKSPALPSPKKSAMKDHSKKNARKTESIKFDLSNLSSQHNSNDVLLVSNAARDDSDSTTEEDMTLHYSDSSNQSPSPRKSINSRSGRILEQLGLSPKPAGSPSRTLTPDSPRARRSIRASMIRKAGETSALSDDTETDRGEDATVASAFRTHTLSPRSNTNLESYSVVDLVSLDSNDTSKSVYNSADSSRQNDSSNSTAFSTPNMSRRKTRSSINPTLLGCSTPKARGARAARSKSSSGVTHNVSTTSAVSTRRSKSLSTPKNKQISVSNTRLSRASRSRSRINDSDLLLFDDAEGEDSSPKSSKRARTAKSVTKDISKFNITTNSAESQGVVTPENRCSPEATGTPVLNIQSLLDSSQSSLHLQSSGRRGRSANYKKKELTEPRQTRRSLGSSVRKASLTLSIDSDKSSDKTDAGASQSDYEEIVTPRSTVKITPEDVKTKHSTARKPLSKRSIIDDLDQSDIVQQLFNSPVKRKLSQSITEFSRKHLFDAYEEIARARRPTRNTVALTERTPNSSILDYTEAITPERFVSSLHTASPELSGLSGLLHKNTSDSVLRNARSVKGYLNAPRARRSIKSHSPAVQDVKTTFAKSPQNRLSDVRVKELFAVSPKNDLTDVRGVRKMFKRKSPENDLTDVRGVRKVFKKKSPENDLTDVRGVRKVFKKKSPENDLTDVRGVRRMFKRKSPENDLSNVSGVKRILRNTTPRNDLTDVRGVRRMFRRQKQTDDYPDVSGVEELFSESNHSANRAETLFDTLFGKPTVKSVYSKSFSTKMTRKLKAGTRRSLHSSIEVTTDNVEEWLERELQKRLHKEEPSTSRSKNISKNTTDRDRQILITDSVEGGEPALETRTGKNSDTGKRSASQAYSAHTLPIKKRSIAEASLEKSKRQLPIKKRAVAHSTPVKGRGGRVAELGRVSPIAALTHSATRSTQIITVEESKPKPAKTRTPRKQETPKKIDISKQSPPQPVEEPSPPKRTTRNRKPANVPATNTKKRRSSIVVTKKAPVMSTRASTNSTEVSYKASPRHIRATRIKKVEKVETPKRTRVRAATATVVVAKPSPKLKPQRNRKAAAKSQTEEKTSNTTRKTTVAKAKIESPKISPRNTRRTRANATVESETREPQPEPAQTKRGRKAASVEQPVQPKRARKTKVAESNVLQNTKTRGRKPVAAVEPVSEVKQPRTRRKQVTTQDNAQSEDNVQPARRGRGKKEPIVNENINRTRGKKVSFDIKPEETQSKTRAKKDVSQTSEESEPRGRRTKGEASVVREVRRRKRKGDVSEVSEELPSKVAKTETKRGNKAEASLTETTGNQKRAVSKGKKVDNSEPEPVKVTRGTRSKLPEEVKEPVQLPVRKRRAAATKEKVAAPARGKNRANTEPSPAKEPTKAVGRRRGR